MTNENYPLYTIEKLNNLKELVNYSAATYGDLPAFIFEQKEKIVSTSYNQFKMDIEALGTALLDMGLRDSKVAVIGENSYEWILTYFAVVNSGNIVLPLDKELPVLNIRSLINHSGADVLVFSDAFVDIATHLQGIETTIKHYININDLPELVTRGNLLIQNNEKTIVNYQVDDNALATMIYTSGTTGVAKGVMLSHKNIASNAVGASQTILLPDSSLLVLPLHHSFAFTASVLTTLIQGCSIAINHSLKTLQSDIIKYKPRNLIMVPLFIETLYKQIKGAAGKNNDKENLSKIAKHVFGDNLAIIVSGGAPIDKKYIIGFKEFGILVLEGYGITECSPIISVNRNQYYNVGSVGQVIPTCKVKILNPDESGHGEICVNGDIVMIGYYNNELATEEAFEDEWFKTGDIGYLDKDGFLFISGRKKNLIILSNGKNVYPEELEFDILNHMPYVKETVVYADNNKIVAEMFLDITDNPDIDVQIDGDIARLNEILPYYKNIDKIVIRKTEFQKTTTKKIMRQYKDTEGEGND